MAFDIKILHFCSFVRYLTTLSTYFLRDRQEREAGNDPDKEDSDDDVMMANPFQPIGKHLVI